jgi:hypothetical protein
MNHIPSPLFFLLFFGILFGLPLLFCIRGVVRQARVGNIERNPGRSSNRIWLAAALIACAPIAAGAVRRGDFVSLFILIIFGAGFAAWLNHITNSADG